LDAASALPFGVMFDRVLVDAPCSGTGTLGRHPEIRWRLKAEQLSEFHELQVALLRSALASLKAGGRLVYSTCSMEAEENELVVEEALRGVSGVHRAEVGSGARILSRYLAAEADAETLFDDGGYFRTSPGVHRTDGFFGAVIESEATATAKG
jgi:16S rRNA (cytosine967-C5)-methyltransferase